MSGKLGRRRVRVLVALGGALILLGACGLLLQWTMHQVFDLLDSWDPKEEALRETRKLVEAASYWPTVPHSDTLPLCLRIDYDDSCWVTLNDGMVQSRGQYSMTVVYYGRESDPPSMRSGDEVTVRVDFARGQPVDVYLYQGCIDWCLFGDMGTPGVVEDDSP